MLAEMCYSPHAGVRDEAAEFVKALTTNKPLQEEFIAVVKKPGTELIRLSKEVNKIIQSDLKSGLTIGSQEELSECSLCLHRVKVKVIIPLIPIHSLSFPLSLLSLTHAHSHTHTAACIAEEGGESGRE